MSYRLTIEPLGATIEVEEGQTVLDAALRQGIYIPHACCHGLCGTCKVQVSDGEVDLGAANPFALMDFERDEGKALACCCTLQSDVTIEADIEEEPDAEVIPVRDFAASVTRIVDLTPTIKALHLALDKPIGFQAGQYVQIEIPGLGQSRAFSIANSPAAVEKSGEIELNVRIVAGGAGTGYLHQQLQVGDRLRLAGPYGRFFVRRSAGKPMLFMAGGSGLSSPRSMIVDLLEGGCTLPITLVYGQRSRDELYYDAEFRALAEQHPNFSYVPALSNEAEGSGWTGARGYVHDAAKAHFGGSFQGQQAYLCGPPPMVEACIGTLMQGRLFERDIYTEKFLSAADAQNARSPLFKRV
ncbi:oxidoreductase FAD/NAD(P)-binding domain protein [Leptothrix cholodnii SP-6]|uniref:Oxidoreductase FAD/NAD(P)-binding domain protein n=1 Tax=Leptothrix cholodnii (strain ATCC 51168 / LMG 8142 / SP-6) TaxID=395495 RepID=B1Y2W0_LEPCP|nr:phenol 2-monooxygenase domain-containing protein [Leptothrix cholodnii]ACB35616.1 oxidoreductase FAD/NAD(P)-binding domain protein [Leptothrix cholodnii SP-6]